MTICKSCEQPLIGDLSKNPLQIHIKAIYDYFYNNGIHEKTSIQTHFAKFVQEYNDLEYQKVVGSLHCPKCGNV